MIEYPIVPQNPADLPTFLNDYLSRLAGTFQAIGAGQAYPHSNAGNKEQFWDDLVCSFNSGRIAGVNVPTWSTLRGGISAWAFSATAMNEIWISPVHITHTYKPNTKIYPHIHWTTAGTNTGVVRWGIEYTFAKGHNQGAFPTTTTIYLEQAASGTAYQHMIVEATADQAIDSANIETDALILMRIFRDAAHANDTCTDTAFGLMCDMHYQKGYWATKNKAPDFYG